MLILERKRGTSLAIGPIRVHVLEERIELPRRNYVRIGVDAPADFAVVRAEILPDGAAVVPLTPRDGLRMVAALRGLLNGTGADVDGALAGLEAVERCFSGRAPEARAS